MKGSQGQRKTTREGVVLEWALEKNKQRIYYPAPLSYPFPLREGVKEKKKKCTIVKGVTQKKKIKRVGSGYIDGRKRARIANFAFLGPGLY